MNTTLRRFRRPKRSAADAGAGTLVADARRRLERLGLGALFMPRAEAEREGAAAFLELEAIAAAAPGAPPFVGTPREEEFLASDSGRLLFVGVMPRKDFSRFEVIDQPLADMRAAIEEVRARVPGVEVGMTGKPVLQADEMATTNTDMNLSSAVGMALCVGLFMAVFRGVKLPMLAFAAFLVGCALTYASAALLFGRLNLLSVVFMLVLVGEAGAEPACGRGVVDDAVLPRHAVEPLGLQLQQVALEAQVREPVPA
ncbi:MAG: MMPL family transporter, partial [Phycisphaerales bacterium]